MDEMSSMSLSELIEVRVKCAKAAIIFNNEFLTSQANGKDDPEDFYGKAKEMRDLEREYDVEIYVRLSHLESVLNGVK